MLSKYHQHAILTGCVDSFCLVCESHLRSEEDVANHIVKTGHLKNLSACPYIEKFNSDHIRKVKKGYFCEFCNLLLPTAANAGLHISDPSHNNNKEVQLIKRIGNNVLVFGDILLSEHAWNGLILETCAVCNMEFNNLKLHIADRNHLLNLIQRKVEFGNGSTTAYRKIDDTSFYCLICNAIFALNSVSSHCKDHIHKTNVDKCRKCYQSNFKNNRKSEIINGIQNGKDDCLKPQVDDNATSSNEALKINKNKHIPKFDISDGNVSSCNQFDTKHPNNKQSDPNVDKNKLPQKENKPTIAQTRNVAKDLGTAETNNVKGRQTLMDNKEKLFKNLTEFEKNGVNINFERETAFCKKCFESVELNIEVIKRHIVEHKTSPKKEATANTVYTLNEKCCKTVLNSKEKEDRPVNKAVNLDQNHNITKEKVQGPSKEEEIIKIDLRKTAYVIEESEENNSLVKFVPGTSTAVPQPEETTSKPAKEVANMNDSEIFAKHNNLTYNKGNSNAFCRICNKKIPAAIKNMQEHVAGMCHKTKIARITEIKQTANARLKKPMGVFIHHLSEIMNVFGVDDVVLNDRYCLTRMSYNMITTQNRLRCQACEVNLREEDVCRHVDGEFHERAMENTPVVTSLGSEFVREVRTGLYHCGYCNLIVGPWEHVSCHLSCAEHARRRRDAAERRARHLPEILAHRERREELMAINFLQHFCPGFFF